MNREEITQLFEQQAPNYDTQWQKMASITDGMYFLICVIIESLPANAKILCVGAGTGKEVQFLADRFPSWQFTIVEPSHSMMGICVDTMTKAGYLSRCSFHEGYLDTLTAKKHEYDAATCLFVSHFILDVGERTDFFKSIASHLKPKGLIVSSDLSFDVNSKNYESVLGLWLQVMSRADVSPESVEKMKATYAKDVAILSEEKIISILSNAGFIAPTCFYQAGLIRAFFAKRN